MSKFHNREFCNICGKYGHKLQNCELCKFNKFILLISISKPSLHNSNYIKTTKYYTDGISCYQETSGPVGPVNRSKTSNTLLGKIISMNENQSERDKITVALGTIHGYRWIAGRIRITELMVKSLDEYLCKDLIGVLMLYLKNYKWSDISDVKI
jgi:hypothetical protein